MQVFNLSQIRIEKNSLMLITALVYILGVYAGFAEHCFLFSVLISFVLAFFAKVNITKLKYLFAWIIIFYLGMFSALFRVSETDLLFNIAPIDGTISGKIVSIPNSNIENNSKFFFEVSKLEYEQKSIVVPNSKLLVSLKSKDGNSAAFDKLKLSNSYKITGSLRRPFKPGNPSQFDYGKYLRNFNAHTVFYAEVSSVEELPSVLSLGDKFFQRLNDLRAGIIKKHARYLKSPNLELLGGIVFGDDAVAPPDYIKASFINSGLLHILAASGMNVAFIYGFWFIIAGWLRLPYKIRIAGGIPLIVVYALMTGLGASVVRAAIMIIFVLVGKLIDRDSNSISLLAFVAFLMLLVNPAYLNDVGFQLSFVVTFGILLMSPLIITFGNDGRELSLKDKTLNFISGAVFIPLIAQIWVMPIQMFYFNTISLYSLFANILTVPFLSVVSFGGFVSSILAPVKYIGNFICHVFDIVLNPLLTVIVKISAFFASLPNSLIVTVHPNLFQVFLYYIIVIALVFMLKKRIFTPKFVAVFVCVVLFLGVSFFKLPNNRLEVIFFDVQNADCILLKTPKNEYFMIDTGKSGYDGGKSQAEFIVTKYLKDKGIKKLNTIIVSHFDNDHAGGAVDLMKYGKPERVFVNSGDTKTYTAKRIFEYLKTVPATKVCYAKNNDIIYEEPNFRIVNYFADFGGEDENENSIITLVEYAGKKLLFTGDAGIVAMSKLKELPANIDVLKVPHHGAAGVLNSALVEKFKPDSAIISVGKNVYGHPDKETLELLKDSSVYRTDIQNSIKLVVTPNWCKIYCWDMREKRYKLVGKN